MIGEKSPAWYPSTLSASSPVLLMIEAGSGLAILAAVMAPSATAAVSTEAGASFAAVTAPFWM
jgi:hypothetical protein